MPRAPQSAGADDRPALAVARRDDARPGMLVTSEPMPISVTINAASATEPPSWRTVERDHRQDRAFAETEQERRPERRDGDLAQAEGVGRSRGAVGRCRPRRSLAARGRAADQRRGPGRAILARSRPEPALETDPQKETNGHFLAPRACGARLRRRRRRACSILRLVLGILILLHGIAKLPPPPESDSPACSAKAGLPSRAGVRRLPRRDRRADPAHRRRLDAPRRAS